MGFWISNIGVAGIGLILSLGKVLGESIFEIEALNVG
jgi:hypothetical protein